ncbi:MAG: hypothetical protein QOI98_3299 [Solirubrobacteraceae bacterium]|jgi:hypothetical protein|nr:hypothetical protein [Solirubrobacteraceae bacterium]
MKRLSIFLVLLLAACASSSTTQSGPVVAPGHGVITIEIVPNPVVATKISDETYEFPFEVVVRESGGHTVNVNRVTADVTALGAIHVANESYDATSIRALGYATSIPAGGALRYRFNPRHEVPDDRLFGGVAAEITVDATDDTGQATIARTTVTVRR